MAKSVRQLPRGILVGRHLVHSGGRGRTDQQRVHHPRAGAASLPVRRHVGPAPQGMGAPNQGRAAAGPKHLSDRDHRVPRQRHREQGPRGSVPRYRLCWPSNAARSSPSARSRPCVTTTVRPTARPLPSFRSPVGTARRAPRPVPRCACRATGRSPPRVLLSRTGVPLAGPSGHSPSRKSTPHHELVVLAFSR